jgi:hypothetical protein
MPGRKPDAQKILKYPAGYLHVPLATKQNEERLLNNRSQ